MFLAILLLGRTSSSHDGVRAQQADLPDKPYGNERNPQTPAWVDVPGSTMPQSPADFSDLPVPQSPGLRVDWTRMLLESYRDGNWEIYDMKADGSDQVNLSNAPTSSDLQPEYDQSMTRIVFSSDRDGLRDIYTMNPDGSGVIRLTYGAGYNYSPSWSPDGRAIVFVSNRDGSEDAPGEIYSMNADGSNPTRLTYSGVENGSPAWSPDGGQILWVKYNDVWGALWLMDADGSNPHALTTDLLFLGHPAWTMDGSMIGFDCDYDGDYWNELVTMNSDGSNLQLLFDPRTAYTDVYMGDWIPESGLVMFTYVIYDEKNGELYIYFTRIEQFSITDEHPNVIIGPGYNMNPNLEIMDRYPPVSRVLELPEFSPIGDFTLHFTGEDTGISGIFVYDLQYRPGTSSEWQNLLLFLTAGTWYTYQVNSADIIYYRSRAQDNAENWEAWPTGNGDAWTKFFISILSGGVFDQRGYPIPKASLNSSPAPWENKLSTGMDGAYQLHLRETGDYSLGASHPGYSAVSQLDRSVEKDATVRFYLPPEVDMLQNGDFEAGQTNWNYLGPWSLRFDDLYEGVKAAQFGFNCDFPCLGDPFSIYPYESLSYPSIALDNQGRLYLLLEKNIFSVRSLDGSWSTPVDLGDFGSTGQSNDFKSAIAVDEQYTVHVVIVGAEGLYYLSKPSGGNWSSPELFANGRYPALAASREAVYVSYFQGSQGIVYQRRSPSGGWELPVTLTDHLVSNHRSDVTSDVDGVIHFVYPSSNAILYRRLSTDGSLSKGEMICMDCDSLGVIGSPSIAVDPGGRVNVIVSTGFIITPQILFYQRGGEGNWSKPQMVDQGYFDAIDLAVDQYGGVYIVANQNGINQIDEYTRLAGEESFQHHFYPTGLIVYPSPAVVVDHNEKIFVVWSEYREVKYRTSAVAEGNQDSSIQQAVSIPPEAHAPTLAFMYDYQECPKCAKSQFEVYLTDSSAAITQVFSATTTAFWTNSWLDLTPWLSQTITLTFNLHQAGGEPYVSLALDDISVGEWTTPVPQAVYPSSLPEDWASATITVTGLNFTDGAVVNLGSHALNGVTWIDEHTLQATLPENFPAGIYPLWVTNPDGKAGVLPVGFTAGKVVFLPMLRY